MDYHRYCLINTSTYLTSPNIPSFGYFEPQDDILVFSPYSCHLYLSENFSQHKY